MKVLFSITYYTPYVSGLTIAAARFAEGLTKAGHKVTVTCIQHERDLPQQERLHGVTVHRAPYLFKISKGFLSFDWFVSSWTFVAAHEVVVVHLPQFEGWIPALFAKLMGKKLVALYHCEVALPNGFINGVVQSLLEVANMTSLLLADEVITYTADYAKKSALLRHVPHKLHYIVPPIPTPRVDPLLTDTLRKQIGKSAITIGVSARLAREKGIEYLLEALPQMDFARAKIVIAGPMDPVGEADYKARIVTLIKAYKKQVVCLGEIAPEKIGSFYRLLDALVLPSLNSTESFGMVQVEAMLMGVPVVASNLPGVRVPIRKTGMGIVVPPRNSGAIAYALKKIVGKPDSYRKPIPHIRKYFSESVSMQAFIHVLHG